MPWPQGRLPRWWMPGAAAASATALAAAAVVAVELTSARPPEGREIPRAPLGSIDGAVHLAGTGTALPLARVLVEAWRRQRAGPSPAVVHPSLGSRGGLRALREGVVDLALLATPAGTRPELPEGVRLHPIALAAVAVAVHPTVPDREISTSGLVALFDGTRQRWSDGLPVVPLLREGGDSATRVAADLVPGLGPAIDGARARGRSPTLITDRDMGLALESTPGAVGLHDAAAIHLEARAIGTLALDGVEPRPEALRQGRYPLGRVIALATTGERRAEVDDLLAFVRSEAGHAVIEAAGYVAVGAEP